MRFDLALLLPLLGACSSSQSDEADSGCPAGARACPCRNSGDALLCDSELDCDETFGCVRVCQGFRDVNTNDDWDSLLSEDCDVVSGYLTLLGTEFDPPLTSLMGLESLKRVDEHLSIYYHDALLDLSGLDGLSSVGDYVYLSGNASLTSLSGLNNLTRVGADFSVTNNASLENLRGLEALIRIGSFLEVGYNYALEDLAGLENLRELGGDLNIEHNGLTSLAPLHDWPPDVVAGELRVYDNVALPVCEVLSLDAHLDANCPEQGPFQCIGNDAAGACP